MRGDWNIDRRTVLALLGTAGVGALSVGSYLYLEEDEATDGSPSTGATDGADEAAESPRPVDIREFGAAVDGTTDDSDAIVKALEQAAPDGTVLLPPGDIVVDGEGENGAIRLNGQFRNVALTGGGAAPEATRLVMKAGQEGAHTVFEVTNETGGPPATVHLSNLTIDGNASEQRGRPGFGIVTNGGEGTLVMRDCVVRDTINAGLKLQGGFVGDITHCRFVDCGDPELTAAHAINANQTTTRPLNIERCLFQNSAGAELDIGDDTTADYQTVNIDRCVFEMGLSAIKLDPGNAKTTVTNSRMTGGDRTFIAIKANNNDYNCGSLELDNVVIEDVGGPAIDIGSKDFDSLILRETALRNVENEGFRSTGPDRTGAALYAEMADVGGGSVSVHDVGPDNDGDAVWFRRDCTGSLGELVHDGTGRVGDTDGVDIGEVRSGAPLEPDVVAVADVGPRATDEG